jgi:hypothetical protein
MLLLYQFYYCPKCDPPRSGKSDWDDDEVTPVISFDLKWEEDEDEYDWLPLKSPKPTLPLVACTTCGTVGYAGSMCVNCGLFRP